MLEVNQQLLDFKSLNYISADSMLTACCKHQEHRAVVFALE